MAPLALDVNQVGATVARAGVIMMVDDGFRDPFCDFTPNSRSFHAMLLCWINSSWPCSGAVSRLLISRCGDGNHEGCLLHRNGKLQLL